MCRGCCVRICRYPTARKGISKKLTQGIVERWLQKMKLEGKHPGDYQNGKILIHFRFFFFFMQVLYGVVLNERKLDAEEDVSFP